MEAAELWAATGGAVSTGASPVRSFRNLGSEKPWRVSFCLCPVGGARQPQPEAALGPESSRPAVGDG